ncbi:ATP-grasp domain-containing protein, partial [Clostridium sp.]|uniref:ATP-grasp domain-containing protein n=1 Tax=Clostridium sp. TaxID=1506 RepID=UPI003F401A9C
GKFEIEEYISGDMYHVDGIFDGEKIIFIVVSKYNTGCLEFKNNKPLSSYIIGENELRLKIVKEANKLLTGMMKNIRSSFHIEFIVEGDERIVLCEVASRTGGALISKTIEMKYGVTLNEYSCLIQLDSENRLEIDIKDKAYGFILIPPINAIFKGVTDEFYEITDELDYYELKANVGERYEKGKHSSDYVLGCVLSAKNENELVEKINKLNKTILNTFIWHDEVI